MDIEIACNNCNFVQVMYLDITKLTNGQEFSLQRGFLYSSISMKRQRNVQIKLTGNLRWTSSRKHFVVKMRVTQLSIDQQRFVTTVIYGTLSSSTSSKISSVDTLHSPGKEREREKKNTTQYCT